MEEILNTENIQKRGRGRPRTSNIPQFATCTITGKQVKINSTLLRRHLEKTKKTIEEYLAGYVCREAKEAKEFIQDQTPETPAVIEEIADLVEQEKKFRTQPTTHLGNENFRKELIKTVWEKISQNPPEYYQEKFRSHNRKV